MKKIPQPGRRNGYLRQHAQLLISSYHRITAKHLVPAELTAEQASRALFEAAYGVVSHNTMADPVFNYGNQTALNLFEQEWVQFTQLPSRQSAEPVNRAERALLLERVTQHGFIDDYRGIRISSSGQRFMIEDATVWNLIDENNNYCGQAAVFYKWNKL